MNYADPGLAASYRYGGDAPHEAGKAAFDVRLALAALYRNRGLIVGIVVAALLLGITSILLGTPRYRATASVQIDQRAGKVLGTEDAEPAEPGSEADRFLQTQVDVLNSRALAIRVAQDLHLFTDDVFLVAMGAKAAADAGARRDTVLGLLARNLRVALPRNSRVVAIAFDSADPRIAADVANSYARSFIYANLQRRFAASRYSRAFLEAQLAQTKTRLEQSERALIAYARIAGLIDASGGTGGADGPRSLVAANLVDLNQAYAAARAGRIQAQQRWEEARAAPVMSLPEVLGNPAVQQLTQRRAELGGELEQLRQRLKVDHPTVRQAQAQIAALDRQIDQLAGGLLASIGNQYRIASRQERALAGTLAALKGATLAEQDRGVRYNILKREVDTNRELYMAMLQRFKEVSAEAGVTSNNISIVDTAEAPRRPISPRPIVNVALALVLGAAAAIAAALAREMLDDVVRSGPEVEAKLGLPLLGIVPRLRPRETPWAALTDPGSIMNEAHHAIRTALELVSDRGLPDRILVTSSREGEGKSTTSLALARDLAGSGKSVLLVDADLRRPTLHRVLGLNALHGLSTVLARQDDAEAVVQPTDLPNLRFVASGPLAPDPGQLLNGPALPRAIEGWANHHDIVIVDGPPLLALADAVRLAANVSATIFVVAAEGARHGAAKAALRRLAAAGVHVAGAVLTKYDARRGGYVTDYYGYRG